jgi:hypothetical protein
MVYGIGKSFGQQQAIHISSGGLKNHTWIFNGTGLGRKTHAFNGQVYLLVLL